MLFTEPHFEENVDPDPQHCFYARIDNSYFKTSFPNAIDLNPTCLAQVEHEGRTDSRGEQAPRRREALCGEDRPWRT